MTEVIEVTHKTCNRCDQELPLESFYKQKGGKYGHRSYCKGCTDRQHNEDYLSTETGKQKKKEAATRYARSPKGRETEREYYHKYKKHGLTKG